MESTREYSTLENHNQAYEYPSSNASINYDVDLANLLDLSFFSNSHQNKQELEKIFEILTSQCSQEKEELPTTLVEIEEELPKNNVEIEEELPKNNVELKLNIKEKRLTLIVTDMKYVIDFTNKEYTLAEIVQSLFHTAKLKPIENLAMSITDDPMPLNLNQCLEEIFKSNDETQLKLKNEENARIKRMLTARQIRRKRKAETQELHDKIDNCRAEYKKLNEELKMEYERLKTQLEVQNSFRKAKRRKR